MILAVVGSRYFKNYELMRTILNKIDEMQKIDMIVSGGASGADRLAYEYAVSRGITFVCHPPKPEDGYPRKFFRRNIRIANHCEKMIAFPTKSSKGTWHALNSAVKMGKDAFVVSDDGKIEKYE